MYCSMRLGISDKRALTAVESFSTSVLWKRYLSYEKKKNLARVHFVLTNYMEHNCSWEADRLVNHEIPLLLLKHKIHFPSRFSKIHFNIIIPLPESSEWFVPFTFPDQNFVRISHLAHVCYLHLPSHSLWCDHPNNIKIRQNILPSHVLTFKAACMFETEESIYCHGNILTEESFF